MLNRERAVDYLNMLERLYVFDGFAGWDPEVGTFHPRFAHMWKATTRLYHSIVRAIKCATHAALKSVALVCMICHDEIESHRATNIPGYRRNRSGDGKLHPDCAACGQSRACS